VVRRLIQQHQRSFLRNQCGQRNALVLASGNLRDGPECKLRRADARKRHMCRATGIRVRFTETKGTKI
jgi:hypothetical protein